jgi:hypothetical protein
MLLGHSILIFADAGGALRRVVASCRFFRASTTEVPRTASNPLPKNQKGSQMNSYEAFMPPISSEARKRIAAGLLEIEALWHTYPHRDENAFLTGKRYLSLAYDVFAQEIFSKMNCIDELLEDTLVKLAYDAVIEHHWVHWMVGTLVPSRSCTEHLFKYWVPAGQLQRVKSYLLPGRIAAWRAKAIRRELSSRKTPAELLEEFRNRQYPNLSHEALADEIGIERSRYFKLKAGDRVRHAAYAKVSLFTKIPISDLMPPARLRKPPDESRLKSDRTPTD